MSETFDGYHVWLGIPPTEQPVNHYRLLGIAPFETDPSVIDHAADRQMAHVRTFQAGRHAALSQRILNELASARVCLLNPKQKAAYDEQLRAKMPAAPMAAVPLLKPLPKAQPISSAQPVTKAQPVAKAQPATKSVPRDSKPAHPSSSSLQAALYRHTAFLR